MKANVDKLKRIRNSRLTICGATVPLIQSILQRETSDFSASRKTLRVTVLRGGISSEREVSLESGSAVSTACRRLGYEVIEGDISPDNLSLLNVPADVIFLVLHGNFGEDGQLQAILEDRDLPFVGCGSAASMLAMDKIKSKLLWRQEKIPTPDFIEVSAINRTDVGSTWPVPSVVKPVSEGSSIGVTLARTKQELIDAMDIGIQSWGRVMIEPFLQGIELTVGILGRNILPALQIIPNGAFYDYAAKYCRNDTLYNFNLQVDAALLDSIGKMSLKAFDIIGGRDFCRVDWILDSQIGPQLLEINTIPGFTSHSLLPKAAQRSGYSFDQLVEKLINLALSRSNELRQNVA